ncbi:MAG TPA: HAD family phosphatase [Myxococcales bacterium]|nr:HAD family phosphatase [Myxococcales bacterium]
MRLRAAIFDLDGTLVDNMAFHARAWSALFARLGVQVPEQRFAVELAGRKNEEIFPLLLGRPLPAAEMAALAEEKERSYRAAYAPSLAPVAGLNALLARLREAGLRLAVATAAPAGNRDLVLDGLALRSSFEQVIGAEHAARGKPAPDIFLAAAAALRVEPGACVAFEDAPNGVRAARAAGMQCCALTTSADAAALREAGAQYVVPDFIALPRPLSEALFGPSGTSGP